MAFLSKELRLTRVIAAVAVCVIAFVTVPALWQSYFKPASYELKQGMTKEQVIDHLGQPDVQLADGSSEAWYYHERGKVILLRFLTASGELETVNGGKGHPFYRNSRL